MDSTIITSILSMAGLGLFFASVLALANQRLKVEEDPRVEKIEGALPGINCGACGYTSCRLYAEALARGEAPPDRCRAGGTAVACELSRILGVEVGERVRAIAIVHCGADTSKRKEKAFYKGVESCVAAELVSGGALSCRFGCLGYGDCVKACPFGAITLVQGLPRIDGEKCTACGKCTLACPRKLITVERIDAEQFAYVACANTEKGAETRKICPVGCIGCGLCQKMTGGVFSVENNLAGVQYGSIKDVKNIEDVVAKCPTKCIRRL
jgi:electron transport complex protein RnfB